MVILFECPNGHRLHSHQLQPGMWIRCPRCGSVAQIPESSIAASGSSMGEPESSIHLSGDDTIPPTDRESPTAVQRPTAGGGSSPESGTVGGHGRLPNGGGGPDEWREYFCPNGHLLRCTPADQGRPAQCPECGSRFRIPTFRSAGDAAGGGDGLPFENRIAGGAGPGDSGIPDGRSAERSVFDRAWVFRESFARLRGLSGNSPLICELRSGRTLLVTGFQEDLCDAVFGVFTAHVGVPLETDDGPSIRPELLAVPWTEISLIRFPPPGPESPGVDLTGIGHLMDATRTGVAGVKS